VESYQREFIEFLVRAGVLTFGDFVTKSGRRTPYFLNFGNVRTGAQLAELGRTYAAAIRARLGDDVDVLFGPAYKGIPIAAAAAQAYHAATGRDVGFCFDRKERKDHGEGGQLVGCVPTAGQRVVIVEDVTTAGTSIRQTVPLLRAAADVRLAGLVVGVDRRERGTGDRSALAELADEFSMETFAVVTIDDVTRHLAGRELDGRVVLDAATAARIEAYRSQYGA
jgi:orotate phosphoribosyltransferase